MAPGREANIANSRKSIDLLHNNCMLSVLIRIGDFCHLLITFANSLDQDQARQNEGPDLDPNCLTHWWYSWKIFFFEKDNFKKVHRWRKTMQNYPTCKAFVEAKFQFACRMSFYMSLMKIVLQMLLVFIQKFTLNKSNYMYMYFYKELTKKVIIIFKRKIFHRYQESGSLDGVHLTIFMYYLVKIDIFYKTTWYMDTWIVILKLWRNHFVMSH